MPVLLEDLAQEVRLLRSLVTSGGVIFIDGGGGSGGSGVSQDHDVEGGVITAYDSLSGIATVLLDNGDLIDAFVLPAGVGPTGTGGTTSPLTTQGDLWGFSTVDARVPVGADGTALLSDSSDPLGVAWGAPSAPYVAASVSGSVTVSYATAQVHKLTMTGNITTLTLSGTTSGRACGLTLYLVQDATGSRLVTWPASVKWPGSVVPVLSTVGNSVDIVVMETFDGGTSWFANLAGKDYR